MKRLLAFAVAVSLPSLIQAQAVLYRGVAVGPTAAIRLWVPAGEVEVRFWDRDSLDVEAIIGPEVTLSGGGARGAAKFSLDFIDQSKAGLPSGRLLVTVPIGAKLWIKSTTAAVSVAGGTGELDVLQVTGNTTVRDASGVVTVESIDGDIELWRTSAIVRLRAGGGEVRVNDASGRFTIRTVSGDVRFNETDVTDYRIPGGTIETVGGSVRLFGALMEGAGVGIETHDGNIDLFMTRGAVPDVFPGANRNQVAERVRALGGPNGDRGISVRTFKGDLNIQTIPGI